MAWSVLLITQFMLVMGNWLVALAVLFLRPQSPSHRSLALFLTTTGAITALNRAHEVTESAVWLVITNRVGAYLDIVAVASLLYFLVVYSGRRKGASRVAARLIMAGATVAVFVVGALEPCLLICHGTEALGGPFQAAAIAAQGLAAATAGAVFARWAHGAAATAHWLMGLAFTLSWATFTVFLLGLWGAGQFTPTLDAWEYPALFLGVFPAAMAVRELARRRVDLFRRAWAGVAGVALGLSFLAGLSIGFGFGVDTLLFMFGLARWAFPILVAFAVVRHRLLDSELHVDVAMRRGVVASAFAATFFILSESLEQVVPTSTAFAGIGAAVVIAVSLRPLFAMANRLAHGLEPADGLAQDDKQRLYQDQATLIWEDGDVGPRERRVLDHLAKRLDLSNLDQRRLEAAAKRNS